jgi:3-oxoacyl-[acyl-carrier protein] reductase
MAALDGPLAGQVAFVTGGGSGLGAAICRRLAADGAHVVVNDLDRGAAEAVAGEVGGRGLAFDVVDAAAVDAAVDAVVAEHGRLDIVVNNAGILNDRPEVLERSMAAVMARLSGSAAEPVSALSTLTDAEFDRMLRVHVHGTFHGMRAALRHMEPARRGAIVNLASVYGLKGSPTTPEYAAAKHAIVGLTRSTGLEVAPLGIRVNAVAPGFIDTPLLAPIAGMARDVLTQQIPAGRFGRPEEVADLVAYLAGPSASYCFGEVLTLTGGY